MSLTRAAESTSAYAPNEAAYNKNDQGDTVVIRKQRGAIS